MVQTLPFSQMVDEEIEKTLKENKIGLTIKEAKQVETILGRAPTLTEAVIFGIQCSEHCAYRSTKKYLKTLPTEAPNVILGPVEDAGIVEIAKIGGKDVVWCGGMLETGIGRLHNLHFQSRSEFNIPGDTSGSDRYYAQDIVEPKVEVDEKGFIQVPTGKGLGAVVREDVIMQYTTRSLGLKF